jgi:hypothetical protein
MAGKAVAIAMTPTCQQKAFAVISDISNKRFKTRKKRILT